MARFHKPNPEVDRAIVLAIAAAESDKTEPIPYSYGVPCYWAYKGAFEATRKLLSA